MNIQVRFNKFIQPVWNRGIKAIGTGCWESEFKNYGTAIGITSEGENGEIFAVFVIQDDFGFFHSIPTSQVKTAF